MLGKKQTQFQSRVTNSSKNLTYQTRQTKQPLVHHMQKKFKKAKQEGLKQIKETWGKKPLHGWYPQRSQQADVDQSNNHQWLHSVGLKAETEGFVMTAQNQSLYTKNYQARIIKNGFDFKCRMCNQYYETVDHFVFSCPVIYPTEY